MATIVADFGDCCRIRRQIVAVSGDYSRQSPVRTGLKSASKGMRSRTTDMVWAKSYSYSMICVRLG